jgi:hypothetical protein
MNKTHTLKELADIGAGAAYLAVEGTKMSLVKDSEGQPAREAFTKAILDAIGYDEERKAFDAWWKVNRITFCNEEDAFQLWKAAREELRKEVCSDQCEDTKTEPDWILWNGDRCPIQERTKRKGLIPEYPGSELFCCVPLLSKCPIPEDTKCEVKFRNGETDIGPAKKFDWDHAEEGHDIIAYRILD